MVLFCEYIVLMEHLAAFHAWVKHHPEHWNHAQLLENVGQPGVYVEVWQANDAQHAATIEKERREGRSWKEMEQWLKTGSNGSGVLRIWTFRPVAGGIIGQ
ncbi:MAG: hypothetical protein P0Y55_12720 [Candidatus Cohnella colombiensis]|uniref:Uncharacterized protein n=1 Tax=Candidatus Cohnella colombiensis TaxID=3121368 RepID=A0AA95EV19_9BACL|nr:MAG: hypothetical protein P0Y55_12720 [Cohnella sp.]